MTLTGAPAPTTNTLGLGLLRQPATVLFGPGGASDTSSRTWSAGSDEAC